MKNLFITLLFSLVLITSASAQRFGTTAGNDNTGRVITYDWKTPTYTSTVTVAANASVTMIMPAAFSGTVTPVVNANVTNCKKGDKLEYIFTGATGVAATITFNTNFKSTGTLAVTGAKYSTISFIFNGTYWIEERRAANSQ